MTGRRSGRFNHYSGELYAGAGDDIFYCGEGGDELYLDGMGNVASLWQTMAREAQASGDHKVAVMPFACMQ